MEEDWSPVSFYCGHSHGFIVTYTHTYGFGDRNHGPSSPSHVSLIESFTGMKIVKFSLGRDHSIALLKEDSVLVMGSNGEGQLNVNSEKREFSLPTQILRGVDIRNVFCGFYQSFFVAYLVPGEQTILACGANSSGQLGVGDVKRRSVAERVQLDEEVDQICSADTHTVFLTSDGAVFVTGSNSSGQLGNGEETKMLTVPQYLTKGISRVSCGVSHSVLLSSSHSLFVMGSNKFGQLGLGGVGGGRGGSDEKNSFRPICISSIREDITAVTCGDYHTLVVADPGNVYSFGNGKYGQLGTGEVDNLKTPWKVTFGIDDGGVIAAHAGATSSFVVNRAKKVYYCGTGFVVGGKESDKCARLEHFLDLGFYESSDEEESDDDESEYSSDEEEEESSSESSDEESESTSDDEEEESSDEDYEDESESSSEEEEEEEVDEEECKTPVLKKKRRSVKSARKKLGSVRKRSHRKTYSNPHIVTPKPKKKRVEKSTKKMLKSPKLVTIKFSGSEKTKRSESRKKKKRKRLSKGSRIKTKTYNQILVLARKRKQFYKRLNATYFLPHCLAIVSEEDEEKVKKWRVKSDQLREKVMVWKSEDAQLFATKAQMEKVGLIEEKLLLDFRVIRKKRKFANKTRIVYFGQVNSKGLRHGKGREYRGNRRLEYFGRFKDGKRHGSGTEFKKDGRTVKVKGKWKNGRRKGEEKVVKVKKLDKSKIEILEPVGHGSEGSVFKVRYRGRIYAEKHLPNASPFDILDECTLLASLSHRNVVKFVGMVKGRKGYLMEYASLKSVGSVIQLYRQKGAVPFDLRKWEHKLRILYGTVCGLDYLHSRNIVLFDLKWDNVLLTEKKVVKICDFGRSKRIKTIVSLVHSSIKGTVGYLSPEVALRKQKESMSKKCDVFSLGICIFCLLVLTNNPFKLTSSDIQDEGDSLEFCRRYAKNEKYRPRFEDFPDFELSSGMQWLIDLMRKLWVNAPQLRPSMAEIKKIMEENIDPRLLKSFLK